MWGGGEEGRQDADLTPGPSWSTLQILLGILTGGVGEDPRLRAQEGADSGSACMYCTTVSPRKPAVSSLADWSFIHGCWPPASCLPLWSGGVGLNELECTQLAPWPCSSCLAPKGVPEGDLMQRLDTRTKIRWLDSHGPYLFCHHPPAL